MRCAKMRTGASAGRWLLLVTALSSLIVVGLGLRALATLVSSQDFTLVKGLAGDRTGELTALAHGASVLGRSSVLVPGAALIAILAGARGRRRQGLVLLLIVWSSHSRPIRLLAMLVTSTIIAAVALSRVYLGVHYPTDVAAGILLGGAWSVVAAAVLLRGKS